MSNTKGNFKSAADYKRSLTKKYLKVSPPQACVFALMHSGDGIGGNDIFTVLEDNRENDNRITLKDSNGSIFESNADLYELLDKNVM